MTTHSTHSAFSASFAFSAFKKLMLRQRNDLPRLNPNPFVYKETGKGQQRGRTGLAQRNQSDRQNDSRKNRAQPKPQIVAVHKTSSDSRIFGAMHCHQIQSQHKPM